MAVMTSAGSTLSIATGAPATYDATGFTALTYVVVGEVTDIGEVGREYALVTHMPVGSRTVKKFKGSYNNGSMQIQMGRDTANAGQTAMKAALLSDADYSFKVTLQDLSKIHFVGKVTTFKTSVGSVDQITGSSCTIEINGDIVEI
jgi:hypothetical protein